MLRRIRVVTATLVFVLTTLLFLDFTGTAHRWFGWLAKAQLVPAVLSANLAMLVILAVATLLFGRIYCSVLCPLGIMQDGISKLSGRRKGKKNRFSYSAAKSWLRYAVLLLYIVAIVVGVSVVASLLDPYAAYGRVASNLLSPLYRLGNNTLAWFAEKVDSYTFYSTEVWIKSGVVFGVAVLTLFAVGVLAWRNGRTYCNTICPVGALLGLLSRFSLFRISFDADSCTQCGRCERSCKASCIDSKSMAVDHSRCVACFTCMGKCNFSAIKYSSVLTKRQKPAEDVDRLSTEGASRRGQLTALAGAFMLTQVAKAQQLQVDGGLAEIADKKPPHRKTPLAPPGAQGLKHMQQHCTACQLCVSACPNRVLRPSMQLETLMQPEMSYERGYCRPECTECSQVCPTGAIKAITAADKTAVAIGYAVWAKESCLVNTDRVQCTSCERHCPTKAITMVAFEPDSKSSLKTPVVDKELCIGCGACEYLCPVRPLSAIHVEGNVRHHLV